MAISRMRIACWIPKAIHTLTICNTYYFYTATMVTRTRLTDMLLYIACLVHAIVFGITISRCLESANQLSVRHTVSLFTVGEISYSNARLSKVISQNTKKLYT